MTKSSLDISRAAKLLIVVLLLYQSYRYPFKINSSGTSPTYSDTPMSLQIGKFVIAALGLAILILARRRIRFSKNTAAALIIWVVLACVGFAKMVISGNPEFFEPCFWAVSAGLLVVLNKQISADKVSAYIYRLFLLALVVDLIQVYLFAFEDRLPALAYEGTYSVRFGSFLDDPNGFAGIAFLFIGWSVADLSSRKSKAVLLASSMMILLSQSLTAIGFLAFLYVCLAVREIVRHRTSLPMIVCCVLGLLLISYVLLDTDLLSWMYVLYQYKAGSISGHTHIFNDNHLSLDFYTLTFGSIHFHFYESWWAQAVVNFGVLWACGLLFLSLFVLWILYRQVGKATVLEWKRVCSAFAAYSAYFVAGSSNLPFFNIFPNDFIFSLILFSILNQSVIPGVSRDETLNLSLGNADGAAVSA